MSSLHHSRPCGWRTRILDQSPNYFLANSPRMVLKIVWAISLYTCWWANPNELKTTQACSCRIQQKFLSIKAKNCKCHTGYTPLTTWESRLGRKNNMVGPPPQTNSLQNRNVIISGNNWKKNLSDGPSENATCITTPPTLKLQRNHASERPECSGQSVTAPNLNQQNAPFWLHGTLGPECSSRRRAPSQPLRPAIETY